MMRFVLLFSLLPLLLFGQGESGVSFRRIEENLTAQMNAYPQEKIHLHTDRNFYVPGEKIRFKAYITDGATFQYPTPSRYVYVELIDSCDSLVGRVMIRPCDELFYGHLFLSEFIPEGYYTLRAYTRYMENLGDDYFFKKIIRIGNLPSVEKQTVKIEQPSKFKQENSKVKAKRDDFDVSFFPEGGNLPEGVSCRVAFKSLKQTGYPESISGIITDETGAEIASVKMLHAGMGMFTYYTAPGKRYYLKCRNGNGLEKQFELPQADALAYSLTAFWKNKELLIGIQKSVNSPDIPCYLLVHCRGFPLYFSTWDKKKDVVTFAKEQLPAGIIHFVLFDAKINPLSERLVFNKKNDDVKVEFYTHKALYEKREKVISSLSLTDSVGNPLTGNLSVAITDDNDIAVDSTTTILSSLLLTSELKGYIENPAWYLHDNAESATALDYLMMTHGWRRYNIPEVVKGNLEYPSIPFQTAQEISGKVKNLLISKPLADSEIVIWTQSGDFGTATTDDNGNFLFLDFEYPDSTSYFIQALSKKGSRRVELVLNRESFPALNHAPQALITEISGVKEGTSDEIEKSSFIKKAEQRSKYDADMRVVHLSEVVVTAPKIERKDEPRLQFPLNSGSDKTIRREDFELRHPRRVSDILQGVAGVQVFADGSITIKTCFESGPPLVLLDGVPVPTNDNMNLKAAIDDIFITVNDVESIDIFKCPGAAIFGFRGANGVISITTRRGSTRSESKEFNYAQYTPLGYQKPVEFYAPKYETIEAKSFDIPDYRTTIFWKPDVVTSNEGKANFEFYTADFPTTYSIVIEGLTTDGRIIRQMEKIQVQ